ncbi:MAG: malto-oligosyltrehalose synthase [Gordonia sp. (in: high G+C Gram-positive bacteria)]
MTTPADAGASETVTDWAQTAERPTIPPEPIAFYRIQLTEDFAFAEVVGVLDQLVDLGISHLYLSPILEAMPGSTHGYDWCPPGRIAPLLGGEDGYRLLRAHARAAGVGIILDIVPNHCGIRDARCNPWWADVLRHGADSDYFGYFDVWTATVDDVSECIVLPWLGSDADLEHLTLDDGDLVFFDWRCPTAPGTVHDGDSPQTVYERQHYRLLSRDAKLMTYRRFTDISELAALRQDAPEVFEATHAWLKTLVDEDLVDGVRVDHLDGLADPIGYTAALRELLGPDRLIYVERGLAIVETLDPALQVDGTTGYDQLREIEVAYTAAPGIIELDEIYLAQTGTSGDGDALREQARRLRDATMRNLFPVRLRMASASVAATAPHVPLYAVEQAVAGFVAELIIARPDYPSQLPVTLATIDDVRQLIPSAEAGLDALTAVFTDRIAEPMFRISELAAAVAAKAIEDIGFHRTARLVSTQERGCNPRVPTISRPDFHERNRVRARDWPLSMNATSTHDTLRSGDVRARISLLAQVPQRWHILVHRLWHLTPPPDRNIGYFLLQNVVGVWPAGRLPDASIRARLAAYALSAIRQAGVVTSWADRQDDAEREVLEWLSTLMSGEAADLIRDFVGQISAPACDEAMSRKVIALLGPGVGDIYQGSQWWDFSLTDPDNRRPVDYTQAPDHEKSQLIRDALAVRRRHPASFGAGSEYRTFDSRGEGATHLMSFGRGPAGEPPDVAVIAVRLSLTFRPGLAREETTALLPDGVWRDARTGERFTGEVTADVLLGDRPVVILERDE